jgi:serralysin
MAIMAAALVVASGGAIAEVKDGTNGADNLKGTNNADRIDGRAGSDTIRALGGNDKITGGRDKAKDGDEVRCGEGHDRLFCDEGDVTSNSSTHQREIR